MHETLAHSAAASALVRRRFSIRAGRRPFGYWV